MNNGIFKERKRMTLNESSYQIHLTLTFSSIPMFTFVPFASHHPLIFNRKSLNANLLFRSGWTTQGDPKNYFKVSKKL